MNKEKIMPTIATTRLILRTLNLNDVDDIFTYANKPELAKYVFWNPHQTINDTINFITTTINNYHENKEIIWAVELKNKKKVIGTCGFINYYQKNKCLEVGYALNQDYQNKGYGKEALKAIIDYGFNNLDAIRIQGICVNENIASEKTMLSCNMKFEGILHDYFIKNNQIHDCKLFAITKKWHQINK